MSNIVNWRDFDPARLHVSKYLTKKKEIKDDSGNASVLSIGILDLRYTQNNGRAIYPSFELPHMYTTPKGIKSKAKAGFNMYKMTGVIGLEARPYPEKPVPEVPPGAKIPKDVDRDAWLVEHWGEEEQAKWQAEKKATWDKIEAERVEECREFWEKFVPALHDRIWELILDNYEKLVKKDKRKREERKEKIQEDWEESFPLPFYIQKNKKSKKGDGDDQDNADEDDAEEGDKTSSPLTVIPLADHDNFKTLFTDPNTKPLQNAAGKPMKFDEIVHKLADRMIDMVPVVSYSRIEVSTKYQTLRQSALSVMVIDVNEGGGGMQQSQQTETSARFRTKYGDSQGAFLQEFVSKLEAKSTDDDDYGGDGGSSSSSFKRKQPVKHNMDFARDDDDDDDGGSKSRKKKPASDDEADDTPPPPPKKGKATEEADEEVSLPAATPSIANVSFGLGMPKRRRA